MPPGQNRERVAAALTVLHHRWLGTLGWLKLPNVTPTIWRSMIS
jgi:hypothetical protein